jgi:hypothetical protein
MTGEERDARLRLFGAAAVVLVVIVVTGLLLGAVAGGRSKSGKQASTRSTTTSPTTTVAPSEGDNTTGANRRPDLAAAYRMPTTSDPIDFGEAYIRALLTYDTTQQTYSARRTALLRWTPEDGWFDDAEPMLDDFLGGSDSWDAVGQVHQSQTVVINRAWVPESVTKKIKADPEAFDRTHWPYIVTANVVRELRGDVGANSDLPLTVSVLVSCARHEDCVALAPGRSVVGD